jgi:transcriptional regulator with XRE-family HTH domain
MTLEAFGSNLRRIRLQRGITLAQITASTKIAEDLLEGLERNDFSQWPSGIYARAWVSQYAAAIGADAFQAVDEFCRYFPQGDRRAEPVMRAVADKIGHRLAWHDEDEHEHQRRATDRRARRRPPSSVKAPSLLSRLRRLLPAFR